MGLILLQLVRRGGAARVFVSEPDADRRQLALQLGAAAAIDPLQRSVPEEIKRLTDKAGVAVAFETAGLAAPLVQCLDAVGDHGEVVIVGVNAVSARLDLDLYTYHPRNLTLKWSWGPVISVPSPRPFRRFCRGCDSSRWASCFPTTSNSISYARRSA